MEPTQNENTTKSIDLWVAFCLLVVLAAAGITNVVLFVLTAAAFTYLVVIAYRRFIPRPVTPAPHPWHASSAWGDGIIFLILGSATLILLALFWIFPSFDRYLVELFERLRRFQLLIRHDLLFSFALVSLIAALLLAAIRKMRAPFSALEKQNRQVTLWTNAMTLGFTVSDKLKLTGDVKIAHSGPLVLSLIGLSLSFLALKFVQSLNSVETNRAPRHVLKLAYVTHFLAEFVFLWALCDVIILIVTK